VEPLTSDEFSLTGLMRVDCGLHVAEPMKFPPTFPLPVVNGLARLPSNWYELAMLFTLSAKLYNVASAYEGTGVDASECVLNSCEKSRLLSNISESAGDKGADGIVGAALQDIADIVEPHGDSGPVPPAHAADVMKNIHLNLSKLHPIIKQIQQFYHSNTCFNEINTNWSNSNNYHSKPQPSNTCFK